MAVWYELKATGTFHQTHAFVERTNVAAGTHSARCGLLQECTYSKITLQQHPNCENTQKPLKKVFAILQVLQSGYRRRTNHFS